MFRLNHQEVFLSKVSASFKAAVIGDALGVPFEFKSSAVIPFPESIDMVMPKDFEKTYRGVPYGTWSDDTSLMLALFDSLLSVKPFSMDDYAKRMQEWYLNGKYTADGTVFDIGVQCKTALRLLHDGVSPLKSGPGTEYDNGCGSLMRVLPVAFFNAPDKELIQLAIDQSIPTHSHKRSLFCCALYVLVVNRLLNGEKPVPAMDSGIAALRQYVNDIDPLNRNDSFTELNTIMTRRYRPQLGSGYVVDTLWSAWEAFTKTDSIQSCLRKAIKFGADTDTTACVAGGFAGAFHGPDSIPEEWSRALVSMNTLDEYLASFSQDQGSQIPVPQSDGSVSPVIEPVQPRQSAFSKLFSSAKKSFL